LNSSNSSSFFRTWWRPLRRLWPFFGRLQWKLTLAYTGFTIVVILILAVVALTLLWFINFQSSAVPNLIADGLVKASPAMAPYLEQTPPDQAGLKRWLELVTRDEYLIISIPREGTEEKDDLIPGQFGRVVSVAIADKAGKLLAVTPSGAMPPLGIQLQTQLPTQEQAYLQAALQGLTEPSALASRDEQGHIVSAAPIFGSEGQVVGAIFARLGFPLGEGEFLQEVLQRMILPSAAIMLVVGIVVGALFGFLISRPLTRRLKTLAEVTDQWSEGDFGGLAHDTQGDEVGQLARHLNHMAIQLQNLLQTRQELATLEERNRLARDLHDSVKQQIFAAVMQVGAAKTLIDRDAAAAKTHLLEAEQLVRQAQQELTGLILELRPAALEGKGLSRALSEYASNWSRQTRIEAEVRVSGERPLPLPLEQSLFRLAQEALANVARHSRATNTEIHLGWVNGDVVLTVSDNGIGFNATRSGRKGVGLESMRERIEGLGGRFLVESEPGEGTQVIAELPLPN
jgi:two-component system, NarL family, sensor histidine kinase LiaS